MALKSIEEVIQFAIKNKTRLTVKYRNFDEITSERILSKIEFSKNVLSSDELELFQIDSNYITAHCSIRNETRTFKISRIIEASVIKETTNFTDNSKTKIPILIPCCRNGVYKVINSKSQEVLLFKNQHYEKVKFHNYFYNNTLLIEKGGKFSFVNQNSNYRLLEWYDRIEKLSENFAIVTVNSQHRILNVSNPLKLNDFWFDTINVETEKANYQFDINFDLKNQKAVVEKYGKWGIINFENEYLLDPKFDSIRQLDNELLLISRSGKWGLFDLSSLTWVIEPYYEEYVSYNYPFLVLKNSDNCVLFNILTKSKVFDLVVSILLRDEFFILVDFKNNHGIYDPRRDFFSGCKWELITDYDGKFIYFNKNNKKGCFNTNNNIQIGEPIFDNISRFLAGYSKVKINTKHFFLSEKAVLEEIFLPNVEGAEIEYFGPLTVYQINEEYKTVFKIFTANKLAKIINFKRSDNSRGKSTVKIKLKKSILGGDVYFCIEEMVEWNWDKYGTPRFYPRQFFSLSEDKIEQSVYYSGSDLNKNSWKISDLFVKKDAKKHQYNNYLTPIEETNWKIEDNSKNSEPTRIFFKGELRFEFHAEEVKFGPFINGITELDVCYWADHEGYAGDCFGYVDIHGNAYFDYELNDTTN